MFMISGSGVFEKRDNCPLHERLIDLVGDGLLVGSVVFEMHEVFLKRFDGLLRKDSFSYLMSFTPMLISVSLWN
jgi:hypothetical protein